MHEQPTPIRCTGKWAVSSNAILFAFEFLCGSVNLRPGMYVQLSIPTETKNGSVEKHIRSYSIVSVSSNGFEIIVKRTGNSSVSDWMHDQLSPGQETLEIVSFAGEITYESVQPFKDVLLLAAGIGATLPIALLKSAMLSKEATPNFRLLLNTPSINSIPMMADLLAWSIGSKLDLSSDFFITQDINYYTEQSCFHKGRFTEHDLRSLPPFDCVVICGSSSFAHDMYKHIQSLAPNVPCFIEAFSSPKTTQVAQQVQTNHDHTYVSIANGASNIVLSNDSRRNLLEHLEEHGIPIKSKCRSGICGTCRIHVSGGELELEPDFALSEEDRKNGFVLACCTYIKSGHSVVSLPNDVVMENQYDK